jgi:hypothetical protein
MSQIVSQAKAVRRFWHQQRKGIEEGADAVILKQALLQTRI